MDTLYDEIVAYTHREWEDTDDGDEQRIVACENLLWRARDRIAELEGKVVTQITTMLEGKLQPFTVVINKDDDGARWYHVYAEDKHQAREAAVRIYVYDTQQDKDGVDWSKNPGVKVAGDYGLVTGNEEFDNQAHESLHGRGNSGGDGWGDWHVFAGHITPVL
jgi:hypothetical protein